MNTVEKSIVVNVPVRTAYDQWTQFEEFPQFMEGIEKVRQEGDSHTHWHANIAGQEVQWDADITEQTPDQRVSWRSTTGAHNAGTVSFQSQGADQTNVTLRLEYEPEGFFQTVGSALGFVEIASKAIWKDSKHLSKVAGRKPARGAAKFTARKSKIKVNQ
jgi:uncharacterized membrane protein